jgi:hypothetical protein
MNISLTIRDAEAVAEVLRDPRFCGYRIEQVTVLSDGKVCEW